MQRRKTRSSEPPRASGPRRYAKFVFIGVYLLGLATVPYAMTLGFTNSPSNVDEAELESSEAGRFQTISWEQLSGFPYDFEIPGMLEQASEEEIERRSQEIIPPRVRALDGQPIALRGYVIPTHLEGDVVRAFILAAKNEAGCCFGAGLSMNQWVAVEVPREHEFRSQPFALATVLGKLEVGEKVKNGYVMSLYRMAAQKIREG
ncbi:MAG: DUF3299 domain-containing protein [Proteobacteria bacterium]|nr:DUF3299 domain-containing protein [Pseudomonadota bacterium]